MTRRRAGALAALALVGVIAVIAVAMANRGGPGGALGLARDANAFASLGMQAPRYERVTDVLAALKRGGGSCDQLESRPASSGQRERAECKSGGDDVVIRVFDSPGARNSYLAEARAVLQQAELDAVPTLAGPNWVVSADTQASIEAFRSAIGGEIVK